VSIYLAIRERRTAAGREMGDCRRGARWRRAAAGKDDGGRPPRMDTEDSRWIGRGRPPLGKETEEAAARRKTELRPCGGWRLERMQGNTERGGFVSGVGARKAIECRVVFVSNSVSESQDVQTAELTVANSNSQFHPSM
jgi:hypothetical protein